MTTTTQVQPIPKSMITGKNMREVIQIWRAWQNAPGFEPDGYGRKEVGAK